MRGAMSETSAGPTPGHGKQSMVRQVLLVLGSVGVATLASTMLAPSLVRVEILFLYAAVALSATYAGVGGGAVAMLLGVLVLEYVAVPRSSTLGLQYPRDAFSLIAFIVAATFITALAASLRTLRRRVTAAMAKRENLAGEYEAMRHFASELENANAELEHTNVELERALEVTDRARRDAMRQAERFQLLDHASSVLASSLDYGTTLAASARLAAPGFADWCSVDMLVGDEIKQLAVSHRETPELRHMSEVRARYPLDPNAATGLAKAIRTGETQFLPDVTDASLAAQAHSPEHLAAILESNIRSLMIVPLVAREHIIGIGALTMISTTATRPFDQGSLAAARDLAGRAAVAIDNAQLYQAAVVANESKANFLATMSHELRTPLTAIIGYGEMLAEGITGEVNDAQRQQLARIEVNARQLLALIEEILLYARVESGRESVHLEEVRAKDLVDDAIIAVAPRAQAQHLSLTSEAIAPTLTLTTDSRKLRPMLINLIENAVKFTEHGSVTVRAFARGTDVVFEVQDTGIGIAPEHLELIFEQFWQVEQKEARKVGGSGLGLSTTRRLARLLGGEVTVESQLHVGSTFRIVLPRNPTHLEADQSPRARATRARGDR
jgi:signal transduction histidine kinase